MRVYVLSMDVLSMDVLKDMALSSVLELSVYSVENDADSRILIVMYSTT